MRYFWKEATKNTFLVRRSLGGASNTL